VRLEEVCHRVRLEEVRRRVRREEERRPGAHPATGELGSCGTATPRSRSGDDDEAGT
jgi:hypothetical protein